MQMPAANDVIYLRDRASQFRDTAKRVLGSKQDLVADALAQELLVKADVIEQITHLITRA